MKNEENIKRMKWNLKEENFLEINKWKNIISTSANKKGKNKKTEQGKKVWKLNSLTII